ncbi:MAG: hypothetical protein MZV70_22215 [Desulfobacterales bacterium]|nr:hypothetical protein [Desulfobacterales bacterium]
MFKASDNLKDENVRKAVALSQDKYCGVSALLRKAVPVEWGSGVSGERMDGGQKNRYRNGRRTTP